MVHRWTSHRCTEPPLRVTSRTDQIKIHKVLYEQFRASIRCHFHFIHTLFLNLSRTLCVLWLCFSLCLSSNAVHIYCQCGPDTKRQKSKVHKQQEERNHKKKNTLTMHKHKHNIMYFFPLRSHQFYMIFFFVYANIRGGHLSLMLPICIACYV